MPILVVNKVHFFLMISISHNELECQFSNMLVWGVAHTSKYG